MPVGNTTNLCSHLSCKPREMCDTMIGKKLWNISKTSQNKYNFNKELCTITICMHKSNLMDGSIIEIENIPTRITETDMELKFNNRNITNGHRTTVQ